MTLLQISPKESIRESDISYINVDKMVDYDKSMVEIMLRNGKTIRVVLLTKEVEKWRHRMHNSENPGYFKFTI